MSIKVLNIRYIPPPDNPDIVFLWKCTKCDSDNESVVKENVLLQYKMRSLGLMKVERCCEECGAKHSMELTF